MSYHQSLTIKRTLLIVLFFINLAIIFYFWWAGSGTLFYNGQGSILIALGRLLGLLSEYLILVQLVTIGRVRPVERLYGFDRLTRFHQTLGKTIPFILIFHPILITIGYAELNSTGWIAQFLDFMYHWEDVFKAFLGLVILLSLVGLSLAIVKKKLRYETWHGIHLLMYVAIFLFFGHQINTADVSSGSGLYYWLVLNFIVFGLFLLYRFVMPLYNSLIRYQFRVEKIVRETHDIYSVYISGKNIQHFTYEAGQFANILFLAKKFFQPHPFSFSVAPGKKFIRFSIKGSGDFTKTISRIPLGTRVVIDGPLGVFTKHAAHTHKYLLIAGGIGITPIRSLAESLQKSHADAIVLYGVRTTEDVALHEEIESLKLPYHVFFSQGSGAGNYASGIIDAGKIKDLVPDFKERDIYICGPRIMLEKLVHGLKQVGVQKKYIHYEIFAY